MDIFLVRHGEAAASWGESPDPGLSELGRMEAEEAANRLAEIVRDRVDIVSSPLLRAVETAAPLAKKLQIAVQIDNVFREVPSPVPLEQRQVWLRQFMQQQWSEQGEALTGWRDAAVRQLVAMSQPTVVFTHFLVINAVVGQILGRSETLHFWPANGSITRLRHNGTGLELHTLGTAMESRVN